MQCAKFPWPMEAPTAAAAAMEAAAAVSSSQDGVARPKNPAPDQDALKQERASVAAKLEDVQRQLEALDEKAVD